jgi:hypothetical protein
VRTTSLVLVSLLAQVLAGCGGKSYRLGSDQDDPASGGAGSDGQAGLGGSGTGASSGATGSTGATSGGFAGASGAGTGAFGGTSGGFGGSASDGGAAGSPFTIIDADSSTPLVPDGFERIASEAVQGVAFIAADEEYIYFNNWGASVWRARHDGSSRELLADTAAYHLAADTSHVYWSNTNEIWRVGKTGGQAELVARLEPDPKTFVMWLTLDDSHVYASTYESQTVIRVPKSGGAHETMALSTTTMGGIALDERSVYFAEYTSNSGGVVQSRDLVSNATNVVFRSGAAAMTAVGNDLWLTHPGGNFELQFAIARVPLDGRRAIGYRAASHNFFFANDESHVYWVRNNHLARINRATGNDQTVARIESLFEGLAISRQWVFAADATQPGGVFRLRKPAP